jgi:type IV pilus assembly protein PilQ
MRCVLGVALALGAGCVHLDRTAKPAAPEAGASADSSPLAGIERLHAEGKYGEALNACVDLSRRQPDIPGLDALRLRILKAELARRDQAARQNAEGAATVMHLEVNERGVLPDTYGRRQPSEPGAPNGNTPPTAMQQALARKVTMHLKGADLGAVIEAVARDRQINIIADKGLGAGRHIDVDVDDVPLSELLDYLARNLGVEFYVGESVVWVTAPAAPGRVPMETRVYKLRQGVQFHGSDWQGEGGAAAPAPQAPTKADVSPLQELTAAATEISRKPTALEAVLQRFVPPIPGADYYFDRGTHALIVRNTRDHLKLIETLIAHLDVAPPQVLIEARFVTASVSDLREIGIDWMLDSAYDINSKGAQVSGKSVEQWRSEVSKGGTVDYIPYRSDNSGAFPLGPQGPFGAVRDGNPVTGGQGLNLTYRGLLTEPMFSAVLHALQISGKGRVLSVPRVTTVNNTPAKLRNGEDLLYFDEFQAQVFSTYDQVSKLTQTIGVLIPKGKPIKEELGITLIAVPSVGADLGTVSLMLMPTISEQKGWTDYQGVTNATKANVQQIVAKLPVIERQEVQTKVMVQSGETVVMGGLVRSVKQRTLHKVPLLSALPLVGALFTRLDETEHNENLLIFVTATVISERGENLVPRPPAPKGP